MPISEPESVQKPQGGASVSSIPSGLESIGYQLRPRGHERRFREFGTWEKDGVRVALSGYALNHERGDVIKYFSDGDAMTIEGLITDVAKRSQGLARRAMTDVIGFANQLGLALYLEPVQLEVSDGLSHAQIVEFYSSLGFFKTDLSGRVMKLHPGKLGT